MRVVAAGEMCVVAGRKANAMAACETRVMTACQSDVVTHLRPHRGMAEHRRAAGTGDRRMPEARGVHRPETVAETAAAESAMEASAEAAAAVKPAAARSGQSEPACGDQQSGRKAGAPDSAE